MGRLSEFRQYLEQRWAVLAEVEKRLCDLQEKYESFYGEIAATREAELAQLTEHTLSDRSQLPEWFNAELDSTEVAVEREFAESLAKLEAEHAELVNETEAVRRSSLDKEHRVRSANVALDNEEERLKERNARLLQRIHDFNARIGAMGKGFGFFSNFFKMNKLAKEKKALDSEHRDVAARIEALRGRWTRVAQDHVDEEWVLRNEWVEHQTRTAAVAAKIQALQQSRPRMLIRSTLVRVLDAQSRATAEAGEGDPPCVRCGVPNPVSNHFCHICARRIGPDRPDFDGSLEEIGELNEHFRRFSEGMKACQEIIGLVRGMKSGVEAFAESVRDVESSEEQYPLPKLQIDVPEASLAFGANFDRLNDEVRRDHSVHPKIFASSVEVLIRDTFTEHAIKAYFEGMGEELSRQADSQWE